MFAAKPIRAGGGHLVGGGAVGVVRPANAPAQDIKRKSIIVGARGTYLDYLSLYYNLFICLDPLFMTHIVE